MEQEQGKQSGLDSWDDYISGSFLKASNVEEDDAFVCMAVSEGSDLDDQGKRVRLHLEKNDQNWDFDLNKTNAVKLKELGLDSPKSVVGKKIYFRKVLVRNPKTNQEVDGLRINKIE